MKQTAVEWLVEQICGDHTSEWQEQIKQAKRMERWQITESFKKGIEYWNGDEWKLIDINSYYNKTYKSE